MARRPGLPPPQLRALDRLKSVRGIDRFYLAGGAAIAVHLRHRISNDLDIFGPKRASFAPFQALAGPRSHEVKVVTVGDATLHLEIGGVPVDVVRYPYPLLEKPQSGPEGFPVAGLVDLATNKLAAIAKRGLLRDFWDLYEIGRSGVTLSEACAAYVKRFHVAESDLYHVTLGLTWFEGAEAETVRPKGMTDKLWRTIRRYFEEQAPPLVLSFERRGRK
jgi:Nucleotidyl transferase AbiEii toxin, Type IV TA system